MMPAWREVPELSPLRSCTNSQPGCWAYSLILDASSEANPEANITLSYVILSPNITSKHQLAWPIVIKNVVVLWGKNEWSVRKVLPSICLTPPLPTPGTLRWIVQPVGL